MNIFRGLHNLNRAYFTEGCVATIGNFDGNHLGHQALLTQVRQTAQTRALPSLVICFEPQPKELLCSDHPPQRLSTFRDKMVQFRSFAMDHVLCLRFNQSLLSLSAHDFVEQILYQRIGLRHLILGEDFRFGKQRQGDIALLKTLGKKYKFSVQTLSTCMRQQKKISSRQLRTLVAAGDCEQIKRMLGRPYQLRGRVISGQQIGRQLGVPTANILLKKNQCVPQGVYLVQVIWQDLNHAAVASIGRRPTVTSSGDLQLEVHILGLTANLYQCHLSVMFIKKLRDERKFESLDALKIQMLDDIQTAKTYFNHQHEDNEQ